MNKIKSPDEILKLQEKIRAGRDPNKPRVTICAGTVGVWHAKTDR